MRFYKKLFISEVYKKNSQQILKDIKNKKMLLHTYLVTVSDNPTMQLEIIHAAHLGQRFYMSDKLQILGVCNGYPEALLVVEDMLKEVYRKTSTADIKSYLIGQEWDE